MRFLGFLCIMVCLLSFGNMLHRIQLRLENIDRTFIAILAHIDGGKS